jgi:hypothetical protein
MRDCSSDTIVFYMNVIHLPMALCTAWAMGGIGVPGWTDLPWLVALAAWVTLGAFVFFGEVPVIWA